MVESGENSGKGIGTANQIEASVKIFKVGELYRLSVSVRA